MSDVHERKRYSLNLSWPLYRTSTEPLVVTRLRYFNLVEVNNHIAEKYAALPFLSTIFIRLDSHETLLSDYV